MNEEKLEQIVEERPALVVDDDYSVFGGENADKAYTLKQAVEFIEQRKDNPYKVAYLDVMLPMDEDDTKTEPYGVRILEYLQEKYPGTKVVMISGTHKFFKGVEIIPKLEIEKHLEKYLQDEGEK
jgi:DNA-binding NtrC family response regulator